jgi:hypothetical protein
MELTFIGFNVGSIVELKNSAGWIAVDDIILGSVVSKNSIIRVVHHNFSLQPVFCGALNRPRILSKNARFNAQSRH